MIKKILALSSLLITSFTIGMEYNQIPDSRKIVYDTFWIAKALEDIAIPTKTNEGYLLARWDDEAELIPVKHNYNTFAIEAMDIIEQRIGRKIFDRTSLEDIPASSITVGIIISDNTANWLDENGKKYLGDNICGLVSEGIKTNSMPGYYDYFVDANNNDMTIKTKLYINLGSPFAGACEVNTAMAIYNFGIALGLIGKNIYFDESIKTAAMNKNFWNILKNLYSNKPNTRVDKANIMQYYF